MSEALRHESAAESLAVPAVLREFLPPAAPVESNDNDEPAAPRVGERVGFEIPPAIWYGILACYTVFLGALLAATGGGRAVFAIVVSALYVAMFFGTARALVKQSPAQPRSPLKAPGGTLATLYGPLGRSEVVAQMVVVPAAVAFFGLAILVIRLCVF